MNRLIRKKLKKWYEENDEKILCICGCHGVGKTWLVRDFCREFDDNYIYISMKYTNDNLMCNISSSAVFLVFDDINDRSSYIKARRVLLKLRSDMSLPEYRIIFIGTGLMAYDIKQDENTYMDVVHMRPLNFYEFSMSLKKKWDHRNYWQMTNRDIFKIYLMVGGMPECVWLFLNEEDFTSVRRKQHEILSNICCKLSGNIDVVRTKEWQIINAIFFQDISGNAGFSLRQVNKNARYREYGDIIERLQNSDTVYKLNRLDTRTNDRVKDYRLYLLDVGLAGAIAGIDERSIMNNDMVWNQYNGYLLKTFIIQEYYSNYYNKGWDIRYWHKARAKARLPFVFINTKTDCIRVLDIEKMWKKSISSFMVEYLKAHNENVTIEEITERALEHRII